MRRQDVHKEQQPTDEATARATTRPRVRSVAIVLALAIGALLVAGYLIRVQALRMIPMLTELGVWAAIRTGSGWTDGDLLERLRSSVRRLAAAANRSSGLA
jgi:hypothetical protein